MKPIISICIVGAAALHLLHEIPYSYYSYGPTAQRRSRTLLHETILTHDNGSDTQTQQRTPKLADGCHHVFLDVGSNIGVHARMLLEPHLYPPETINNNNNHRHNHNRRTQHKFTARKYFESQFGPEETRDNANFCIFAFEPNPAHAPRHHEIEFAYRAMGWRYHFIHAGAGDEDGTLTFYHIGKGDKELERGFTTIPSRCHKECRPEDVMVYRLSDWIDREVHGRIIPAIVNVGTSSDNDEEDQLMSPRVVMKMDIEMGEWLVFPDLLTSGVLCRDIDSLLGEFHLRQHQREYPIRFPHRGNWTLNTYQEAQVMKDEMFGMVERNPNCKTELVVGDDESYGADGMPFPKPV